MAIFTNYATLSYNGQTLTSNTVTGEILETVTVSKTAVTPEYRTGDDVTYVVTLVNSGAEAVTGLTVTDDLGAYEFEGNSVYPLAYRADSLRYFRDGVLQEAPAVTAGPPLAITGIEIPAMGNVTLVYETTLTPFAPLGADASVTNTVTVTGGGLTAPVTAEAVITATDAAELSISKALSPVVVSPNGEITYTFTIENTGNTAVTAADNVTLDDTFDPLLSNVSVAFEGTPWVPGTNYTYDEAAGAFATLPGQLPIPAATYAQNPDGTWAITPGQAALTVTGNLNPANSEIQKG